MMEYAFYLKAAALIWLNPWIVVPYYFMSANLAGVEKLGFLAEDLGDNSTRLCVIPYVVIAPVLFGLAAAFMYLILSSINPQLEWVSFIEPSVNWVFYSVTVIIAFTSAVMFSKKGLEGNIGGFIFAPLWLFSLGAYLLAHIAWINRVVGE